MLKYERLSRGWLKIGELAKKLGVPVTTVRYYTEIGLLPVVAELSSGYRLYDGEESAKRMSIVREMNGSRPTLRETKALIERFNQVIGTYAGKEEDYRMDFEVVLKRYFGKDKNSQKKN